MTGPLAQQIAHLEEALAFAHAEGLLPDQYERAIAALSAIERHVQDMETALTEAYDAVDSLAAEAGVTIRCDRSALPASNGGPDGPAGTRNPRNRVAREKGEE